MVRGEAFRLRIGSEWGAVKEVILIAGLNAQILWRRMLFK
jgi:hypothetical protein